MTITLCDKCGVPIGAPHTQLQPDNDHPGDCIMRHNPPHTPRNTGLLCTRHYHRIPRTLDEIVTLYALLGHTLIPGPSNTNRTPTRTGSPAPGRVDVMALTDPNAGPDWRDDPDGIPNIPQTLHSWCRLIDEELPDNPGRPVSDGTVTGSARYLRHWRHYIAHNPWVEDLLDDLHALHAHLSRATGAGMWPQPIGPCPNCQKPLYPTIGVDMVTCGKCGSSWEGIHLVRLRFILDGDNRRKKGTA